MANSSDSVIKKPKILILITKSNWGGAQRYVYDLATTLNPTHEICVGYGGSGVLGEKLRSSGVRTIAIPELARDVNFVGDLRTFFALLRIMREERPSVLHLNSSKIGILGAIAARLSFTHARIVFTAHAWAFNEDRNDLSKVFIMFLHWLTVVLSDITIAVSDAVRKQINWLPFIKRKVAVVHLGILPTTPLERLLARTKLAIPEQDFVIGTIAELHPVKGITYALEALKLLPSHISLVIIGEGTERSKLEKKIEDDDLTHRVTLKGHVPDAANLIPAFDIFLLPSLSEALGYVLLEAGLAQVPVVATSVGGIPEVIESLHSGILVHPRSAKEIKYAVDYFLEQPQSMEIFAKNLHDRVRNDFSLQKMVNATIGIYFPQKQ
ncbi:MAG TPA: glycosyltransferase [Candidatus Paceibacterota bacterium]|nr:glycosyltransferase [Candidatus Paceibacterota bacterium]